MAYFNGKEWVSSAPSNSAKTSTSYSALDQNPNHKVINNPKEQTYLAAKADLNNGKITTAQFNAVVDAIQHPDYRSRAADYDTLNNATNGQLFGAGVSLVDRVNSVVNSIFPENTGSSNSYGSYGSAGSTGSAIGAAGLGSSGSYDSIQNAINEATRQNNEWAAEQAQKQMDFQREMSSTAHQRQVADLQAAGLNPVLSAGGSGASTPSGAMAQPDTTNSRAILELALASLEAVSNTAAGFAGVARASSGNSKPQSLLSRIANSKLGQRFLGSAASALGGAIVRAIF